MCSKVQKSVRVIYEHVTQIVLDTLGQTSRQDEKT